MYCIKYSQTEKTFGANLRKAIKEKYKSAAEFARELNKYVCIDERSIQKNVYMWMSGKIPNIETCLEICRLLNVDLDFLLGNTMVPNNDIAFISDRTGLSKDVVENLIEYCNKPEKYNFMRINAINTVLESEYGMKIVEAVVDYINLDIETLFYESKRGGISGNQAGNIVALSKAKAFTIEKSDIPNVFLTAIIREITKWKEGLI